MNELLEWLDEKERELEELEGKAADLSGFEIQIPGRLPQELAPSILNYQKRIEVLKRQIERLRGNARLIIAEMRAKIAAGLEWRIGPMEPQLLDQTLTQLKAAVNYLETTNQKPTQLVDRIYDYKIKLNFNSPAFYSERRW